MKTYISILMIFFISSCSKYQQKSSNRRIYKYIIDNNDISQFGYFVEEMGEDVSVKSLFIDNEYAFLLDTFHSNIKKIDLSTGKIIKYSPPLLSKGQEISWLRDISLFKGYFFITSDFGKIFILDENLALINEVKIDNGISYIFSKDEEGLNIFIDSKQNQDYNINIELMRFMDFNSYRKEKKVMELNDYKRRSVSQYVRGKKYFYDIDSKIINLDNTKVFHNEEIPKITEYDATNFDFSNSNMGYYYVNKKSLTLTLFDIN